MERITRLIQTETYPIGDCFRTCIACILGYEDSHMIPNFMIDGEDKFYHNFDSWLEDNNMHYVEFTIDSFIEHPYFTPHDFCVVIGKSPRGDYNHAVVGQVTGNSPSDKTITVIHDVAGKSPSECLDDIQFVGFLSKRL